MRRILSIAFLLILLTGLFVAFTLYKSIYTPNINQDKEDLLLEIPSESSFQDVYSILRKGNYLVDSLSFYRVATLMKYVKDDVPSGKYQLLPTWNNRELIGNLRSGNQIPVKVTFNNLRTVEELAGKISYYMEMDSLDILQSLKQEEKLKELGLNKDNILSLFIPNTYNLYWNEDVDKLLSRMKNENEKFWASNDRLAKAEALGLTKEEVYTLASIVEKESLRNDEKPIIAGVYLNRLKRGMMLQADPTVVFAVGDFSIRRVLKKHLAFESPYNTYKNTGLPPGPIYMPSIKSIDAVLSPQEHSYLYFCAKPGYNSEHLFAKTVREHERNADKYRSWLNKERIKK
jgi:UPF0755 protein